MEKEWSWVKFMLTTELVEVSVVIKPTIPGFLFFGGGHVEGSGCILGFDEEGDCNRADGKCLLLPGFVTASVVCRKAVFQLHFEVVLEGLPGLHHRNAVVSAQHQSVVIHRLFVEEVS